MKSLSRVWLFATPWTVAYQAPLPMGFPRQEYWSGLPFCKYHRRVWGVLAVSQPHWVCPHSPRVCFPSLCCLRSRLLCSSLKQAWVVCPSQVSAAQVQVLRYSTKAQTRFGLRFVPFPGLSSSGDQVLGERTLPTWGSASYHLLSPSHLVSWMYSGSAISGELCLLWGADL